MHIPHYQFSRFILIFSETRERLCRTLFLFALITYLLLENVNELPTPKWCLEKYMKISAGYFPPFPYTHLISFFFVLKKADIDETDGGAPDQKRIDLDDFFPYVGEYGKYQKLLTWLIVLPACIPCGLQGFNQLFMADDVAHWCRLPEFLLISTNFTKEQLKSLAIPKDSEVRLAAVVWWEWHNDVYTWILLTRPNPNFTCRLISKK